MARAGLGMFLLVSVGLSACDVNARSEFLVAWEDAYCEAYTLCATDEMLRVIDDRECRAYLRTQDAPDAVSCKFDDEAAELCLVEMAASACDGADPEIPAVCAEAFSLCPLPTVPPSDGSGLPDAG